MLAVAGPTHSLSLRLRNGSEGVIGPLTSQGYKCSPDTHRATSALTVLLLQTDCNLLRLPDLGSRERGTLIIRLSVSSPLRLLLGPTRDGPHLASL